MMEPLVKIHVHDAAGTIILNRPQKRNALSRALLEQLTQALDDLHLERAVRAVILTGAGEAFCAGLDLAEMVAVAEMPDAHQHWHDDAVRYRDLIEKMLRFPKPIIAAVNGAALAGGAGLVLASDLVVAASDATFGLPEPKRGIVAGMVAPLLAFRVGGGPAAYLLMTGAAIDAPRAHQIGLFHELVDSPVLWARAKDLALLCASGAASALQLTKQILNEMVGESLLVQLSAGAAASAASRTTEAAAEGLRAFRDKRQPRWD
jgi:methylglutaconyl-CoA hydratase